LGEELLCLFNPLLSIMPVVHGCDLRRNLPGRNADI
jgi:hypothetical protein